MNAQAPLKTTDGLGYLLDDCYLLHDPGEQHPESPQRLIALRQMLESSGAKDYFQCLKPREASPEELNLVHTPAYIEQIEAASAAAPFNLDLDTSVSVHSYRTALLAAGGVLECIDSICSGRMRRVFAFIRPPGHHASRERAGGFCLFNNAALAAAYAMKKHKLDRVAIVDTDVHHGNGTQSCFYTSPNVLFISSHQYPFYPGSGSFPETGRGEGKGYTINFPLPAETADATFIPVYSKIIATVLDQYQPQLILVSAGFDGHARDPLGQLLLTHSAYASAAASLMLAADRVCNGNICFILEGGYNLQALKDCALAVMSEMKKEHPSQLSIRESALFRDISKQAARSAAGIWKW
jgi:acetoin utilization deacetylase AcuC-like enzyme